jgi:hypothetical protein
LRNKKTLFAILFTIGLLLVGFIWWDKTGQLPEIKTSQVKSVKIWAGHNNKFIQELSSSEDKAEIEKIVEMLNGVRKVSSEDGTTPDAGIFITLNDGSEIRIWELDANRVTVEYQKQNGTDYQTNVNSHKLAIYFKKIMNQAGIEG